MGVHWSLSPGHAAPESTGQCAPHASDFTTFQPWAAVTGQMTADDGITPATGFGFPKLIDPSLEFTPSLTSFPRHSTPKHCRAKAWDHTHTPGPPAIEPSSPPKTLCLITRPDRIPSLSSPTPTPNPISDNPATDRACHHSLPCRYPSLLRHHEQLPRR